MPSDIKNINNACNLDNITIIFDKDFIVLNVSNGVVSNLMGCGMVVKQGYNISKVLASKTIISSCQSSDNDYNIHVNMAYKIRDTIRDNIQDIILKPIYFNCKKYTAILSSIPMSRSNRCKSIYYSLNIYANNIHDNSSCKNISACHKPTMMYSNKSLIDTINNNSKTMRNHVCDSVLWIMDLVKYSEELTSAFNYSNDNGNGNGNSNGNGSNDKKNRNIIMKLDPTVNKHDTLGGNLINIHKLLNYIIMSKLCMQLCIYKCVNNNLEMLHLSSILDTMVSPNEIEHVNRVMKIIKETASRYTIQHEILQCGYISTIILKFPLYPSDMTIYKSKKRYSYKYK